MLLKIILNRNSVLLLSLALGIGLPGGANLFKDYTTWILAFIMLFSTSGIGFKALTDVRYMLRVTAVSVWLNYVVLGTVILGLAYLLIDDSLVFAGFVVIVAGPPGVAVVPFTHTYNSDVRFALSGILGTFIAAFVLTPLIISTFSSQTVALSALLETIVKIIVLPLVLSRILRLPKLQKFAEKARPEVVNWGFALLIYTAVGLNKSLIFSDIELLFRLLLVLIVGMYGTGIVYNLVMRKRLSERDIISRNLMLTIKSTGFSVATSLALFEPRAAIPAAVLSVVVLFYLLSVGFVQKITRLRTKEL